MNHADCERMVFGIQGDAQRVRLTNRDVANVVIEFPRLRRREASQRQHELGRRMPPSEVRECCPLIVRISPTHELSHRAEFIR